MENIGRMIKCDTRYTGLFRLSSTFKQAAFIVRKFSLTRSESFRRVNAVDFIFRGGRMTLKHLRIGEIFCYDEEEFNYTYTIQ